jgi:hypothetical protein
MAHGVAAIPARWSDRLLGGELCGPLIERG